jgi:hypothetical protein
MPGGDQAYLELGAFIGEQSPYGKATEMSKFVANPQVFTENDATIPDSFAVKRKVLRAGPLKTANANNPDTTDEGDECLEWKINGQEYRITKAIRVHYRFKRVVNGVEKDVGAFLLIGYNGDGH